MPVASKQPIPCRTTPHRGSAKQQDNQDNQNIQDEQETTPADKPQRKESNNKLTCRYHISSCTDSIALYRPFSQIKPLSSGRTYIPHHPIYQHIRDDTVKYHNP